MICINKFWSKYKEMSLALRAGVWFTICNFVQKGISFITIPIFTRIMTTTDYGKYSVYTSWYSLLTVFATLNLSNFVFNKGMVKYPDDRDEFELSIHSLSSFVTVCLFILYISFQNGFNLILDLTTPLMVCMFLQVLTEPSVLYWTVRNRFEYKYKSVVAVTFGIAILNPVMGILAIQSGIFHDSVLSRALSVAVVTTVFSIVTFTKIIGKTKKFFSVKYWKYALAFNIPLIPHFLSQMVLNQADRIMIKNICSASDAAIYSVAYSVGMAVILFSQAIQQTYLPWLYQKMAEKKYSSIPVTGNIFLFILAGINLLVIAFAPELIAIVGPKTYHSAIWVMPPICGSVYFIFLQNLFANIEYYYEQTRLIAVVSVFIAGLNIVLNFIFIPLYGFVAAGYTTLICYITHASMHYFVMRHACKKNQMEINSLFNVKVIIGVSSIFCCLLVVITLLYKWIILRYLFIMAVLLSAFVVRKNVIYIFKKIKNI